MDNFETVISKDGEKSKASLPSIKDLNKPTNSVEPYIQPNTFSSNSEESKYGEDITPFTDLNEVRGERQGLLEKYKNGVLRMAGTATTSFLEGTVGLLVGTTEALATGDSTKLFNNEFGQALDSMNESLAEAAPIYYTKEQQDSILNANFIPDKLFNGAGYMLGAIGSGYAGGKLLGSIAKLALVNKPIAATATAESIINSAKGTRLAIGLQETLVGAMSAHGESAAEARGARKDTYEKLVAKYQEDFGTIPEGQHLEEINRLADAAGNVDYLTNLVVTGGTNMLQFGKLMTGGYKAESKEFWKIVRDRAGKYSTPELGSIGKLARKVSPYTSGMGEEALQEGIQYMTQIGTTDYYTRQFNKEGWNSVSESINSVKDAFIGTINSKEGFESMLLGAILGAGGGLLHNDVKSKTESTNKALSILNDTKLENIKKKLGSSVAIQSYEQDKAIALQNKDIFQYKNLEYDQFKTWVKSRVDTNQFNSLIEELDEQKSLTEEQFKEKFGFPKDEALPKPIHQLVEELKIKAKTIKELSDSIDSKFPINNTNGILSNEEFGITKALLFHTATSLDNTNKRIKEVANKITMLSTINNAIEVFDSVRAASQEDYLANYISRVNATVEERKTLNPMSEDIANLESFRDDIVKLEGQRQAFIRQYNKLVTPESAKQVVDEVKAETTTKTKEVVPEDIKPEVTKTPEDVIIPETKVNKDVVGNTDIRTEGKSNVADIQVGEEFKVTSKAGKDYWFKRDEEGTIMVISNYNDSQEDLQTHSNIRKVLEQASENNDDVEVELGKFNDSKKEVKKESKVTKVKEEQLNIQDVEDSFDESIEAGYTLDKTTATVRKQLEANPDKPSNLRWLNFVDNFTGSPSNLMFKVVTSKSNPALYESLLDPLELEETKAKLLENPNRVFVKFILVYKNTKESVLVDGKHLSTSPLLNEYLSEDKFGKDNTLVISPNHFLRVKGIKDWGLGIEHPQWNTLWEAEVKRKNDFRVKLESGKISYIPIKEKSPGVIDNKGATHISPAQALFGTSKEDINKTTDGLTPRYFIPTTEEYNKETGEFEKYQVVDRKTGTVGEFEFLGSETRKLRVGSLYAIKNGVFYPLTSRKLKSFEVETVANLFAKLEKDPKPELRESIISNYVQLTDSKKPINKNTLFYNSKGKTIHFGDSVIPVNEATTSKEFKEFLTNRRRQVDTLLLKSNRNIPKVNEKGDIDPKNTQTYYEFLFGSNSSAFTLKMKPLGERQVTNSYFVFDSSKAIEGEPIVIEESQEASKEEMEDFYTRFNFPTEEVQPTEGIITEAETKEVVKEVEKYVEEQPKPKRRIIERKSDTLDKGSPLNRTNKNTNKNYKLENTKKAEQWFKERFKGNNDFELTKELIDGKAFGQFYKGIVYLYEKAEEGTIYHEAFHKVSFQYLTEAQRHQLYDEYKAAVKDWNLTDLQVEEKLAEDFRVFVLTGQKAVLGKPVRNTLFRRLYNYIKSLLTADVTIEQVYLQLASKDGYSKYKVLDSPDVKLNRKFLTFSETLTTTWNDTVTGILFDALFNHGLTPAQLVEDYNRISLIAKAYNSTFNKLADIYENTEDDSKAENLLTIIDNYPTFIEQHKNSINALINLNDAAVKEVIEYEEDLEEGIEETENRENTKGEYQASNEVSTVTTTSNNTKMLLATLKKRNSDSSVVKNTLGEDKIVDFNEMYKFLLRNLHGLDTMSQMYDKLEDIKSIEPSVQSLIDRLGKPTEVSNLNFHQAKVWTDFWQDFHKSESRGTITLINPDTGNIYQDDANRDRLENRIKEQWKTNLYNSKYLVKSGTIAKIDSSIMKDFPDVLDLLEELGVTIDSISKEQIYEEVSSTDISNIRKFFKTKFDEGSDISTLDELFKDTAFKKILELAITNSKLMVELSYLNAEGKTIYAITLNNYFSLMSNALNNTKTWDELISNYPQFNSVSCEGSVWLDELFPKDKDGNRDKRSKLKFEVTTIAGIKIDGDNESGTIITKADVETKFIQEFNDLFQTGKSSVPRTADKATDQSGGIKKDRKNSLVVKLEDIKKEGFNTTRIREVFENYFLAELKRIQKFNVEGLGKNIDIYNKKAGTWTIFEDILSESNKEALKEYMNNDSIPTKAILDSVNKDVVDFLEQQSVGTSKYQDKGVLSNLDLMYEFGLIDSKGKSLGINAELTKDNSVEDLARTFTVNHLIQTIEHIKIFYGDKALYKDFYKRTSLAAGTKKYCNNDQPLIDLINSNKSVDEHGFEYDNQKNYSAVVLADENVRSNMFNEYYQAVKTRMIGSGIAEELAEIEAKKVMSTYWEDDKGNPAMTEADAQGLSNIVFHRQMLIKASLWNFSTQEKQYQYEMAYMYVKLHERSLIDSKYSKYELSKDKLAKYEKLSKTNPEAIINIQKTQYFGTQKVLDKDGKELPINALTSHKYSLAPMTWRIVEGTNLEDKLLDMLENQVGYLVFESGVKNGAITNEDGTKPSFYDSEGNVNIIDSNTVKQTLPWDYLGIQVELQPKAKEKVIFGTQFRKLFESNLFDSGVIAIPELEQLHTEYLYIINSLVDSEWNKLTKELGVELNDDGSLKKMDASKLVEILKKDAIDKQLADNLVDSLKVDTEGNLVYPIDSLVNRPKLESLMMSLVSSRVTRQKMSGDSLVQLANTGWETKGKRVVESSNELLSYRVDPVTGKTLPMQVKVPMNAQYKELLKVYKTIERVNQAIKDKLIDKNILTMVGYRIPTQGLNSIEFMEIVGFISDTHGASIILPSEIVAKSGGDFDIDKLNIFRPNFRTIFDKKATGYKSHTKHINELLDTTYKSEEIRELLDSDEESEEITKVKTASRTYENAMTTNGIPKIIEYIKGSKSKKGKQNRIIEISNTILEHPYMFEQLVTPNTTRDMDATVNSVRYSEYLATNPKEVLSKDEFLKQLKETTVSNTQELMVGHIMNQFRDFLGGKNAVGLDAIHITAHVLFQQAGTKVEASKMEINLDAHLEEDYYLFGKRYNKNGKLISDIQSQIANLHLDAAKDPKYKDINLTKELLPTAHFLNHIGVAEDTIIYFIKQPVILELLKAEKKTLLDRLKKDEGFKEKPEDTIKFKFAKLAGIKITKDSAGNKILESYDKVTIGKTEEDKQLLLDNIAGNIDNKLQLQVLEDFLNYREYAKNLGSFMKAINYDTTKFKDLAALRERKQAISDINKGLNSLFTGKDYQDILDKTIVGSFNKVDETYNIFSHLFITETKEFIAVKDRIIEEVNPKGKLAERLPNMIDNDFINYITQKFGTYKKEALFEHINKLFYGDNSLAKQLKGIKDIVGDNVLLNQLQGLIDSLGNSPDNISIYTRKLSKNESDVLTGAYRELSEYDGENLDKVQSFMEDLTTFGILQSGLHNSPITFLSLIPNEYYGDITKNAIDFYKKLDSNRIKDLHKDFFVRWFIKNINNTQIVPNYKLNADKSDLDYSVKYKLFTQKSGEYKGRDSEGKSIFENYESVQLFYKGKSFVIPNVEFKKHGHRLQNFYLQDNDEYQTLEGTTPAVDSESSVTNTSTEPNVYLENGTYYRFNIAEGKVVSGEYKQGNGSWNPLKNNLEKVYDRVGKDENLVKPVAPIVVEESKPTKSKELIDLENKIAKLNDGQKEAVDLIRQFIASESKSNLVDNSFLLSGAGGTGKTFSMEVAFGALLTNPFTASMISIVAPTWNAVGEIKDAMSNEYVKPITAASYLGLKESRDTNGNLIFIPKTEEEIMEVYEKTGGLPRVYNSPYVVIDEASMIGGDGKTDKDLWILLNKRIAHAKQITGNNPKILFMGDYAQIPPVGTKDDGDAYPIEYLKDREGQYYNLTQNMRTNKSDIIELMKKYRASIDLANEQLKKGIPSNQSIPKNSNPFEGRRNSENVTYEVNKPKFVDAYVAKYMSDLTDIKNVVLVNYNNAKNEATVNLIKNIRVKLFGEQSQNKFNKNELLLLNGVLVEKINDRTYEFNNESRFIVHSQPTEVNINRTFSTDLYVKGKGKQRFTYNLNTIGLAVTLNGGKTEEGNQILLERNIIPREQLDTIFGTYGIFDGVKGFRTKDGEIIPYGLYSQIVAAYPDFNYGYVVNAHKVQGSTYKYVFVDEANILAAGYQTHKAVNQLLYTAISRAKEDVVIYNTGNINIAPYVYIPKTEPKLTPEIESKIKEQVDRGKTVEQIALINTYGLSVDELTEVVDRLKSDEELTKDSNSELNKPTDNDVNDLIKGCE